MLKKIIVFASFFNVLLGFGQTFEWGITSGGSDLDVIYSIGITSDGSVISVGVFEGTVDFDPGVDEEYRTSFGERDVFIQKTSSSGEFVWVRSIGGENGENATTVALDGDDNIYVAGEFESTVDFDPGIGEFNLTAPGVGTHENFILKLDPDGNFIWAKSFGGEAHEANNEIKVDGDGNIYCAGFFEGTVDLDPGDGMLAYTAPGIGSSFVIKLDTNGDLIWHYVTNGMTMPHGNSAYDVVISDLGEVTVTGHFAETVDFDFSADTHELTANGETDVFILRLSADGEFVWVSSFGGSGTDRCFQTRLDAFGHTYITGEFYDSFTLEVGDTEESYTSNGNADIFLAKLDSEGDFSWMKTFGGPSVDGGRAVYLCADGNLAITGRYQFMADFDPNDGVFTLESISSTDGYVGKISPTGTLLWVESFGDLGIDFGIDLKEDTEGNIYVSGAFNQSTDLDPGDGFENVTSAGNYDGFLIKLSGIAGLTPQATTAMAVYPNPANNAVNIEFNESLYQSTIEIVNLSGKVVYSHYYGEQTPRQIKIELNQEPGIYFIRVKSLNHADIDFKLIMM
jgi:hypothetical protein